MKCGVIEQCCIIVMDECMNVEDWWNYTERRRLLVLGGKPVPVPLCPPQSSHELASVQVCAPVVTGW
jgi:hypothetical protein